VSLSRLYVLLTHTLFSFYFLFLKKNKMDVFNFQESGYEGQTVKTCVMPDGQRMVSVYDVISVASGATNTSQTFKRLVDEGEFGEQGVINSPNFYTHKFPGQGQRKIPVANAKGAVQLILALPGRRARAFRQKVAETLIRYLGGDDSLIAEIRANQAAAAADPTSVQAFAASALPAPQVDAADHRRKFIADLEEQEERTKQMRIETKRLTTEVKERELESLENSRRFLAGLSDPRLIQTLNDSLNNQLAAAINGGAPPVLAIEGPPTQTHKTIDEILAARAGNYRRITTTTKSHIGREIVARRGRGGLQRVRKYVNGEMREVNAYPTSWEDEIMEIAQELNVL
jgi:hypothetical protein